jgi:hypothetical protein
LLSPAVVFLAEMIPSTNGLGCLSTPRAISEPSTSLLGLLLNTGFNALQRRLLLGFPDEG